MKTFEELYQDLLRRKISLQEPLPEEYRKEHLDCLLYPEQYAPVLHINECEKCAYDEACRNSCIFDAIEKREDGSLYIDPERCSGCEACIRACKSGNLTAGRDVLPAMKAVREAKGPVYMMIAPAFLGQLGAEITPGQLRSAFKALGFTGMVEVALFADILTLKEALEFDKNVQEIGDYQLTSCCCPVWIAMIRKIYHELIPHVPGAVSPMIACGRMLKRLHPDAVTVFAGPCLAKKKEAREPDIADAVDYVLTFQEVKDIFAAADIHPEKLADDKREHASAAGRMYARTGGVSRAVKEMVEQLDPYRGIGVVAEQANGTKECMQMIERIKKRKTKANFFEGMGCVGGCVGGPKAIIDTGEGTRRVDVYAENSLFHTPLENPYVLKILAELGDGTVEELLEDEALTRQLGTGFF
ncbi:4Fe-4S binding protein [Faecalicatena contorta]|uniref:[Fe-Fe] hydrogenase large subunit C-terminal domain-containing protein n=1 Tax=Faecalicatena contorta TaxID=39482 RepID=UPI001F37A9D4|nr:[Fe-Fe] hydrogenase large subunit C-terminal domain-containing protein [Faecalicatena contorta]MCF2679428.1 4Fe-4S binding protein [Faecalicatena contorta]